MVQAEWPWWPSKLDNDNSRSVQEVKRSDYDEAAMISRLVMALLGGTAIEDEYGRTEE